LQAGAQSAGNQSIVWNGQDASGNVLPDGIYSFSVSAVDANGNNVPALNQVKGIVAGVELGGSTPMLDVGNVQVPLSSVTTVGAPN